MQFADSAGPDQGLQCLLTESMATIVYVYEQRLLRSDCMDAHADLDLCCPQIVYEDLFRSLRIILFLHHRSR